MSVEGQIVRTFSIAGSTLRPLGNINASSQIKQLKPHAPLLLKRQKDNPADANAVLVYFGNAPVGFLPRGLAAVVAPLMDEGQKVVARKAKNALYGVCEIAYIPKKPPEKPPLDVDNFTLSKKVERGLPPRPRNVREALAPRTALPEGITQDDIDTATELPPVGDSRPPAQTEEVPDDEQPADPAGQPE